MELKDLIPQKVSFKLRALDRELTLNRITLDDNVWLEERFGEESLKLIFSKMKIREFCIIIARLLDSDSKKYLAGVKIEREDEYGEVVGLERVTLADKIMALSEDAEIISMMNAYIELKNRSNDLVQELTEKVPDAKKKGTLSTGE